MGGWSPSAGATGYIIYWMYGGRAVPIGTVGAGTTSITIAGISGGSTNYFSVAAFNGSTASAASSWVGLTTPSSASASAAASQSQFASEQALLFSPLERRWT